MGDYDDLPYIVIERRSGGAGPFLWGALLGAGAALLLAPRSGEQTQQELRQGVQRVRDAATGRVSEARDNVTGVVARARNNLYDRVDSVRGGLEERAQQAREAIEAGRRAARDARSELEQRVSDAKEGYSAAAQAVRGRDHEGSAPPEGDVVVTEVIVEEGDARLDLG